jgi:Flp pilus assembly protein TadG
MWTYGGRHGRRRGQSLAEFALIVPILLLGVMVLLDFGRVVYAQATINESVRQAIRTGEVGARHNQSKYDAIRAAARNAAPGVPMSDGDITGQSGACPTVDTKSPATCFYPDGILASDRVVVRITVSMSLLTPIISQVVGNSITLSADAVGWVQCSGC